LAYHPKTGVREKRPVVGSFRQQGGEKVSGPERGGEGISKTGGRPDTKKNVLEEQKAQGFCLGKTNWKGSISTCRCIRRETCRGNLVFLTNQTFRNP